MLAIAIDKKGEMEKPTKTAAYEAQVAIEREEAARSYRKNQIVSLVGLPLVTGIGHLAPSVGAARAMLGYWYFDWPILIATSTITAFIDGYDKYRDISKAERPSTLATACWLIPLLGSTLVASCVAGLDTSVRLHRWLLYGFVYGNPLIPYYSFKTKALRLAKPKVVLSWLKSASIALVMANVDADIGATHACMVVDGARCPRWDLEADGSAAGAADTYWRSFAVAFLYNWVRETMCDVRDLDEDTEEGVPTLPVAFGKSGTLALILFVAVAAEQVFMGSGLLRPLPFDSVLRVAVTFVGCVLIKDRLREDTFTWGLIALIGLCPATWAQARL